MTGLFNSFDPLSILSIFSWVTLLIFFFLPLKKFWVKFNSLELIFFKIKNFMKTELKPLLSLKYFKGSNLFFISIFFLIWSNNTFSLFSYIFPSSGHMLFSLSLGLPLWLSFMVLGLKNNFFQNMAHLVPEGTPIYLISFMVIIESVSILIRPITLSVRLAANITAGHLLLSIISWSDSFILVSFFAQVIMFILELMVSFIQAYVFSMLIVLYLNENI